MKEKIAEKIIALHEKKELKDYNWVIFRPTDDPITKEDISGTPIHGDVVGAIKEGFQVRALYKVTDPDVLKQLKAKDKGTVFFITGDRRWKNGKILIKIYPSSRSYKSSSYGFDEESNKVGSFNDATKFDLLYIDAGKEDEFGIKNNSSVDNDISRAIKDLSSGNLRKDVQKTISNFQTVLLNKSKESNDFIKKLEKCMGK